MRKANVQQREILLRRTRSVVDRIRSTAGRDGMDRSGNCRNHGRQVPRHLSFDQAMEQLHAVDTRSSIPNEPAAYCEEAVAKTRDMLCVGGKPSQMIDGAGNFPYSFNDRNWPGCCRGYAYDEVRVGDSGEGAGPLYSYCYRQGG